VLPDGPRRAVSDVREVVGCEARCESALCGARGEDGRNGEVEFPQIRRRPERHAGRELRERCDARFTEACRSDRTPAGGKIRCEQRLTALADRVCASFRTYESRVVRPAVHSRLIWRTRIGPT